MKTNDKTLADVQPGGRVRLGDGLQLANEWRHVFDGDGHDMAGANKNTLRRFIQAIDALSAQPSPGGQGDAQTIAKLRAMMDHSFGGPGFVVYGTAQSIAEVERRLAPGIAASQPGGQDAHELWAMAQLVPGEGIEDGVRRIEAALAARQPVGEAVELARAKVKIAALELQLATYEASAQAVDLGRFRKLASWVVNCVGHGINDSQRRMGEELLALIDSQAVGNG